MRAGWSVLLVALLAATLALPSMAGADKDEPEKRGPGKARGPLLPILEALGPREASTPPSDPEEGAAPTPEPETPAADAPERVVDAPRAATGKVRPPIPSGDQLPDASPVLAVSVLAAGAALLLGLGVLLLRRATRPAAARAPKRRSFEAGREEGRATGAKGTAAALQEVEEKGALGGAEPTPHGLRLALVRSRREPCEHVAGFLTGLFETAWRCDVQVVHPACAGSARDQACVYDVRPLGVRDAPGIVGLTGRGP